MQQLLPRWPVSVPRRLTPRAPLGNLPALAPGRWLDVLALQEARRARERAHFVQDSGTTGTWGEVMFVNKSDYTAFNTSASEGSLLAGGGNEQPVIPALFFFNKQGTFRVISVLARGVLGTTGTPTIVFQARSGTTAGSSSLSGTSVGVSAAITTASGVTNKWWELRLDLTCTTTGIGTGNTTLSGSGYVSSPGGFASPFVYPLEPSTPDTATWTSTIDNSLTQYLNLSVTWGTSSASNTVTLKQLYLLGQN